MSLLRPGRHRPPSQDRLARARGIKGLILPSDTSEAHRAHPPPDTSIARAPFPHNTPVPRYHRGITRGSPTEVRRRLAGRLGLDSPGSLGGARASGPPSYRAPSPRPTTPPTQRREHPSPQELHHPPRARSGPPPKEHPIPRRCSTPYCPHPAQPGGKCRQCRAQAQRQRRPPGHVYNSSRWKTTRTKVLTAEPNCRTCGRLATDVDHITPLEAGGAPFDLHNLQPLCHRCHSEKTAQERQAGR